MLLVGLDAFEVTELVFTPLCVDARDVGVQKILVRPKVVRELLSGLDGCSAAVS